MFELQLGKPQDVCTIVRLDERTGNIFILSGNEIEILISRDGNWRYL
ncbi:MULTISPECIES: DUF6888 family protein [Nostoc cyanobionts]